MEKIDNLDRQILDIITRNARIPSKDVATECGVSRAAIHQRRKRGRESGRERGRERDGREKKDRRETDGEREGVR